MPIYRDKEAGCWRFEFNRRIPGRGRVRLRKRLPKAWDRAEADRFDREETKRLYSIATGGEKPAARITEALALYAAERIPELKHGADQMKEIARVHWAFDGRLLTDLPDVCAKIRANGAGRLAPATIRNRIRYLTAACRWAWKHHQLCEHNPAERVVVPEVRNERQVYTDRAHMLLMAQVARDCHELRALIRIGFYTGMRLGEIFEAEVDHERGLMKLLDTKNGTPRWIPVPARARPALKHLPFTFSRSTLEKRWRMVRDAVLLNHLHFHDLRHTTASEMINADVDLYTVGKVLGHKSPQSTQRYAHLKTDTLAAALAKVGRRA